MKNCLFIVVTKGISVITTNYARISIFLPVQELVVLYNLIRSRLHCLSLSFYNTRISIIEMKKVELQVEIHSCNPTNRTYTIQVVISKTKFKQTPAV